MSNLPKFRKFEDRLKKLKAQRDAEEITSGEYADQAEALRFEDAATGQEWWLDPVDEQWYVASTGSGDFELADPQPRVAKIAPTTPETATKTPPELSPQPGKKPEQPFPAGPQSTPPEDPKDKPSLQGTQKNQSPKLVIGGVIVGIVIITLLCVFSWQPVSTFISRANTPTPTNTVAPPTLPPTETYTPLPTSTSTLPPSATPTAAASPSATPNSTKTSVPPTPASPTSTPIPTDTPAPSTSTPKPTNTPAISATTPTPTKEAQPIFSGKLAYSYFDQAKQTYIIEIIELPNTANPVFTLEKASQPALTSDGSRLAYHSWDSQGLTPAKGIGLFYISLASSNTPNKISRYQESHRPQWGPNNSDKAFSFLQIDGNEVRRQIQFSDEGGMPFNGFAEAATWTPHSRLVFYACQGNRCGLAIANTNGTGFAFLTDGTGYYAPAVSPNGEKIAYTVKTDGNWDVWVMNIDGSNQQRLTSQRGKDGIPTWSPDGNYIAYASQQNGQWEIRVMAPDGSNDHRLFILPGPLEGKAPEIPDHAQPGWLYESLSWTQ